MTHAKKLPFQSINHLFASSHFCRSLPLSEKPPEAIVENGVSEEPQETYEDLWRDEREELYAKVVCPGSYIC